MLWIFNTFERDIRRGRISEGTYSRLMSAETYGAASSIPGLAKNLRRLLQLLRSGTPLRICRGAGQKLTIKKIPQFYDWVKTDFPDTYAMYFEKEAP